MIFAPSFNNSSTFFSSPFKEAIWRPLIPNYVFFCFFEKKRVKIAPKKILKISFKRKRKEKKKKKRKKEKRKKRKKENIGIIRFFCHLKECLKSNPILFHQSNFE